jgi:pyoverdine/dityrosine biosynthesis protein Dit1
LQDILGVPEENVWDYGNRLREIAKERFPHISFVRLDRLVASEQQEAHTAEDYKQTSSWYREKLVKEHLPKDFDPQVHLSRNPSALMTYCGYIKFLETDLMYEESRQGCSKKKVKKMNQGVARRMIKRGTV